ncbi:hypothetical protein E2C01_097424 [Portunus trituberculatus]|uniref:Uncharacterized protein n=1 Tax=Portunus trituberculatus TaxID=210409 RepID=A0A5B7K4T1_PORTR|nr:hypothetical protein [Portunus trituberculatus]
MIPLHVNVSRHHNCLHYTHHRPFTSLECRLNANTPQGVSGMQNLYTLTEKCRSCTGSKGQPGLVTPRNTPAVRSDSITTHKRTGGAFSSEHQHQ